MASRHGQQQKKPTTSSCSVCGKLFTSASASRNHERDKHPNLRADPATPSLPVHRQSRDIIRSHSKPALCVDGLNLSGMFGFVQKEWRLDRPQKKIEKFMRAASKDWEVVVFIDQRKVRPDELAKWKRRREREVRAGDRRVPAGCSVVMGDMFKQHGATVFYAIAHDCDDLIASYAHYAGLGASVLSTDSDFVSYKGATFPVYQDFRTSPLHRLHRKSGVAPHHTLLTREELTQALAAPVPFSHPPLHSVLQGTWLRGCPSPLVKQRGNPYAKLTGLRAALYSSLALTQPVAEEWPEWNEESERVEWVTQVVSPDPALDHLLRCPMQAIKELFPDVLVSAQKLEQLSVPEKNHIFACKMVVLDICFPAILMSGIETTMVELAIRDCGIK